MRVPAVWEHQTVDESQVAALSQPLGINPVIARLLVLRGISDPDDAIRFLNPNLDQLHDPLLVTDLQIGVDRLLTAIDGGERIAIHGDYDVDGVTSTVMLRRVIALLGGDVIHYIPERLTDGYGLQPEGIDRLKTMGIQVVVSVDCGIRSRSAAERAREVGIDLVITDQSKPVQDEAIRQVRALDADIPIIAISGMSGTGSLSKRDDALAMGADRTVEEPFTVEKLIAAVDDMLDRDRERP